MNVLLPRINQTNIIDSDIKVKVEQAIYLIKRVERSLMTLFPARKLLLDELLLLLRGGSFPFDSFMGNFEDSGNGSGRIM